MSEQVSCPHDQIWYGTMGHAFIFLVTFPYLECQWDPVVKLLITREVRE